MKRLLMLSIILLSAIFTQSHAMTRSMTRFVGKENALSIKNSSDKTIKVLVIGKHLTEISRKEATIYTLEPYHATIFEGLSDNMPMHVYIWTDEVSLENAPGYKTMRYYIRSAGELNNLVVSVDSKGYPKFMPQPGYYEYVLQGHPAHITLQWTGTTLVPFGIFAAKRSGGCLFGICPSGRNIRREDIRPIFIPKRESEATETSSATTDFEQSYMELVD